MEPCFFKDIEIDKLRAGEGGALRDPEEGELEADQERESRSSVG